jgi:hypothetical protein
LRLAGKQHFAFHEYKDSHMLLLRHNIYSR